MDSETIKQRLISGAIWSFAGRVVTACAGVTTYFFLARLLGPDEMGAYFLSLSFATAGAMVAGLGLNRSVVRLVAETYAEKEYDQTRSVVIRALSVGAIGATVWGVAIWCGLGGWIASAVFKSVLVNKVVGLVALWTAALTLQNLTAEAFRGFHDIASATIYGGLLTNLVTVGGLLGLWLAFSSLPLERAAFVAIAAIGLNVLIALVVLQKKVRALPTGRGAFSFRKLLRISWPLWVTNLLVFVLLQSNLWILSFFRPDNEVALYGASARLVALVQMPLMVINAVVPSTIAEMHKKDNIRPLQDLLRRVATLAGWPALLVVLTFVGFGGFILKTVYGDFYAAGDRVLLFLSLGQLVNVWVGAAVVTLMMTGLEIFIMTLSVVTGAFNILMSVYAASRYGADGVAIVYCITIASHALLAFLLVRWRLGIWTHMSLSVSSIRQGFQFVLGRFRGAREGASFK